MGESERDLGVVGRVARVKGWGGARPWEETARWRDERGGAGAMAESPLGITRYGQRPRPAGPGNSDQTDEG